MGNVLVVDYDTAWPQGFAELRAHIWPALSDVASAVEHVGSTAVPGLAAKPVIDIDVVVPASLVPDGIARLAKLGYKHRGDLGIPDREAFSTPSGSPRHHIYLCPEGSLALANHLAVRDFLRTHPAEAQSYGELKKRLALRFPEDIDRYVAGKTDFLLRVLENSGFERPTLDDIEGANRGL